MQKTIRIILLINCLVVFGFLSAQQQSKLDQALRFIEGQSSAWNLKSSDISELSVSDIYTSDHNGVTHIYFQQNYHSIPIYNAVTSVHIAPTGMIYDSPSRFYGDLSKKINTSTARIAPHQALESIVRDLKLENAIIATNSKRIASNEKMNIAKTNFTKQDIAVKLVYQEDADGKLKLAYDLTLDMSMNSDHWSIRVDASTGVILNKNNYTIYCKIDHPDHSNCVQKQMASTGKFTPVKTALEKQNIAAAPNSYNVIAFPAESPIHGNRTLLVDPADSKASPYGWHDTNGIAGAESTVTVGNNVNAYLDKNGDNVSDGGQPNGGANLIFDFPFNKSDEPYKYTAASTTNLFYVCNAVHDVLYNFGFDEKSGNFQKNNYNKGGTGNDHVIAEAQDGSGTNNANFSTPADGGSGRMQMYLWTVTGNEINITKPLANAGPLTVIRGGFGPAPDTTPIDAQVVWSDDGSPGDTRLFGCKDSQNKSKLKGKIALINRGDCFFSEKAYFAQNAGAVAVIICSHNDDNLTMAASTYAELVKIPSYYITKSNCDKIKILVDNGSLELRIQKPVKQNAGPDSLDGDFDNGIVVHEFGHGVSNRLTGGPSQAGCLGNAEQMGEGWSDFLSLVFTAEPGDKGTDIRGIGNYALNAAKDANGIRRRPYSTDLTVNEFTYKNINTEVHDLGEVWSAMLWDLYWAFSDKYGFDPSFSNKTAGNNICIQLVMDGMKLQPCSPGFVDGRNAILKADEINNQGKNKCLIWDVFAKRGLGATASQGSSNFVTDETEDLESLPECINAIRFNKKADFIVKPGAPFQIELEVRNLRTSSANTIKLTDVIPDGCSYLNGSASLAPSSVVGNIITWNIPSMAALEKLTIKYKLNSDPNKKSASLWKDDLESPNDVLNNWIPDIRKGQRLFDHLQDYGLNNSYGFYAKETIDTVDYTLAQLIPAALSTNEPSILFYHSYNTQKIMDGGFVEISEDGKFWQKLEDTDYTINGLTGELSYSTFAVPNLKGFSGYSNGFIPSVASLKKYAGKNVQARFRFGTIDPNLSTIAGTKGWSIDNIEYLDAVYYNTEACVSSALGDNICLTAKGKGTLVEPSKITATKDLSNEFSSSIFPNPSSDNVTITLHHAKGINAIHITNADGKIVHQQGLNNEETHQLKINVSNYSKGIYFIEFQGTNTHDKQKLIIQ